MIFFTKKALSGKLSRMSDRQLHQLILETDNYDMRIEAIRRSANAMALADVIVRKPDLFGFVYPRLKELDDEQAMADLALRCPRLPSVGRSVEYVKEIVHYLVHDPKLTERIALESCNPRARYLPYGCRRKTNRCIDDPNGCCSCFSRHTGFHPKRTHRPMNGRWVPLFLPFSFTAAGCFFHMQYGSFPVQNMQSGHPVIYGQT